MQVLHYRVHGMHEALRRVDLNLLLVFDALFRRSSVVLAADELSMSPSACSHALSRLRAALSDELFVRHGSAMQPTAIAEQIAGRVGEALRVLSESLRDTDAFVPATSTHAFTIAATDFTTFALLPEVVAAIGTETPHVTIDVVASSRRESLDELASGRVQFAFGLSDEFSASSEGVQALACFSDDYVVVARKDHPRLRRNLMLKQYLSERHVAALPWPGEGSVIDAALTKQGHRRVVAVTLPSVLAAPFVVAGSELLLTLPRRVAERLAAALDLSIHAAPFDTPAYRLAAFYHVRQTGSDAHQWMRKQIAGLFGRAGR
jgi:DNA-binding transcriptional LysR family regulator